MTALLAKPTVAADPSTGPRDQGATAPAEAGVPFAGVTARQCRWPLSGAAATLRCCGARTAAPGAAYCPEHQARATRPDPLVGQGQGQGVSVTSNRRSGGDATGRPYGGDMTGRRPGDTTASRAPRPLDPRDLAAGLPDGLVGAAAGDPWG